MLTVSSPVLVQPNDASACGGDCASATRSLSTVVAVGMFGVVRRGAKAPLGSKELPVRDEEACATERTHVQISQC